MNFPPYKYPLLINMRKQTAESLRTKVLFGMLFELNN